MADRRILANALKTFMFSLSQGLEGAGQAPGQRGTRLGMAAALGAPMQLQQFEQQQQAQNEERQMRMDQLRQALASGQLNNEIARLKAVEGTVTPEVSRPTGPFGPMGVETPTPEMPLPSMTVGGARVQPQTGQAMDRRMLDVERVRAEIAAGNKPPAAPKLVPVKVPQPDGSVQTVMRPESEGLVTETATAPKKEPVKVGDYVNSKNEQVIVFLDNGKVRQEVLGAAKQPEKPAVAPKEEASQQYSVDSANRTITAIQEVLPKINGWTSGMAGSVLKHISGTSAADVDAELSTVAANIAFNALQQMRAASKTGGALGAVSERELDLLSNVEGAIRQNQRPENLKAQLEKVKGSLERWLAVAKAQGGDKPKSDPLGLF